MHLGASPQKHTAAEPQPKARHHPREGGGPELDSRWRGNDMFGGLRDEIRASREHFGFW